MTEGWYQPTRRFCAHLSRQGGVSQRLLVWAEVDRGEALPRLMCEVWPIRPSRRAYWSPAASLAKCGGMGSTLSERVYTLLKKSCQCRADARDVR